MSLNLLEPFRKGPAALFHGSGRQKEALPTPPDRPGTQANAKGIGFKSSSWEGAFQPSGGTRKHNTKAARLMG